MVILGYWLTFDSYIHHRAIIPVWWKSFHIYNSGRLEKDIPAAKGHSLPLICNPLPGSSRQRLAPRISKCHRQHFGKRHSLECQRMIFNYELTCRNLKICNRIESCGTVLALSKMKKQECILLCLKRTVVLLWQSLRPYFSFPLQSLPYFLATVIGWKIPVCVCFWRETLETMVWEKMYEMSILMTYFVSMFLLFFFRYKTKHSDQENARGHQVGTNTAFKTALTVKEEDVNPQVYHHLQDCWPE